jgi:hypothetical protein
MSSYGIEYSRRITPLPGAVKSLSISNARSWSVQTAGPRLFYGRQ